MLFYMIWRNSYIRNNIRNHVFADKEIKVTAGYIDRNIKYLSLLSTNDKLLYNITIKLVIDKHRIKDYAKCEYKYIIDHVHWQGDSSVVDFSILHQGLRKLTTNMMVKDFIGNGRLPCSIQNLKILEYGKAISCVKYIDYMLSNLDTLVNLKTLEINITSYQFTQPLCMPSTLEDFIYYGDRDSLDWLIVPPNKCYKGCVFMVQSNLDIEWLQHKTWVTRLMVIGDDVVFGENSLPNHIVEISIDTDFNIESLILEGPRALPESLETLTVDVHLTINQGMLPSNLKNLTHEFFKQPLEHGLFPNSLRMLDLEIYTGSLSQGLPSCLRDLYLGNYNTQLTVGVLPPTLQLLHMPTYNQPLDPYVLPRGLKEIYFLSFDQELPKHSLPQSLLLLFIPKFTGSFQYVDVLDQLMVMEVHTLNQSMLDTIVNVKEIKFEFTCLDTPQLSLQHSNLKVLYLQSLNITILQPNFFPSCLTRLILTGPIQINSPGIINDGCIYLKSKQIISPTNIPSSVKYSIISK